MRQQPEVTPRSILTCKVIVVSGMEIKSLSDELTWCMRDALNAPNRYASGQFRRRNPVT